MNVLIVEGSARDVEMVQRAIDRIGGVSRVMITTHDLETSIELLKKNQHPDVIFLPSDNDSTEKIRAFKNLKINSPIIHKKLAHSDAGENSSLIELLIQERLDSATDQHTKARAIFNELKKQFPTSINYKQPGSLGARLPKQRFLIRSPNKLKSITVQEVAYFYADKKLNFIKTWDNNRLIVEYTMEELNRLLDPDDFFRINRSFIVSYKSIRDIHLHFGNRLKLVLNPPVDEEVFVSRERVSSFRQWIGEGI